MTAYTKGWTDIDWVVVDTAVYERGMPKMTIGERFAAITRLSEMGLSQIQIAERLGITDRTVLRMLQRYQAGQRVDCPL